MDTHDHAPRTPVTDAETRLQDLGYEQTLQRTMSLRDVVVYGLIYMVPLAPAAVFGAVFEFSKGQVALVYLVAAIAMFFSAVSYREMAARYPVAGSVYSYVRFGTGRLIGFIAGWAILLDYLLLPALLGIFGAAAINSEIPSIPSWVWIVPFVGVAAAINVRGISITARMNLVFLAIQLVAISVFVGGALVAVAAGRAQLSFTPFFDSTYFSWSLVFSAIPIAALSYVGFDAISTLNEEAKGGGETVARATMIVLGLVAALFIAQVYFAAIFVPTPDAYVDSDLAATAFYDIAGVAVSPWFQTVFTLISALVAIFANTLVSQATTSKLIFSMARDRQLPVAFARLSTRGVPIVALTVVTVLSIIIGLTAVGHIAEMTTLVTFGALTAYILLHISVLYRFGVLGGSDRKIFAHCISPVIGGGLLGYALWETTTDAKVLGLSWLAAGLLVAFVLGRRGTSLDTADGF
ncbi:APC family permease [Aeromicrobium sp. Root472D3]|uniref:APC family permease n=1 Tax=Aeromicrobium sp. Root472D3 TaxID=1736540 RepID=UPI0006F7E94F|nr:APC family permease [Aeromicrobium sp. Root472D3]KQX74182.1 amino acid transporter [Aeromicrobium sp. Root472D3]